MIDRAGGTRRTAWASADPRARQRIADQVAAIVAAAADVLRVDAVAAMLVDVDGALRVVGASDPLALAVETAQLDVGDGPGIEATATGVDVSVADVVADDRWGAAGERLATVGARAILASPIRIGDDVVGNLNAIALDVHDWTPEQVRANQAYARVVAAVLTGEPTPAPQEPHADRP